MDVDLERLGSFVVDDGVDFFDVETTGGQVGGEQEVDLAVAEGFYAGDTLLWRVSFYP